jgi:preprotein translocase subunit SecB
MAEQDGNGGSANKGVQPRFSVLAQYVKDFSFENPNAPRMFGAQSTAPKISLQINVNAKSLSLVDHEVTLMIEGGAGEGAEALFKFELTYCGVLRLENIPSEQIQPLVMIEGPRLLFPFARQIIGDAVRAGGYPPLYIDPIDFQGLYLQRLAVANAASGQATA